MCQKCSRCNTELKLGEGYPLQFPVDDVWYDVRLCSKCITEIRKVVAKMIDNDV